MNDTQGGGSKGNRRRGSAASPYLMREMSD